ncbi:MAG: tetratricopeptide repeat protein [Planctomycetota bacterium]|jgi:tetratricopeptide (TPR) repeat protein
MNRAFIVPIVPIISIVTAIFLVLVPVSRSEVVTLKTGEKIRGKIVSRGDGQIVIESLKGRHEIALSKVSAVEELDPLLAEYRSRIGLLPDTNADGFYKIASWCSDKGLFDLRDDILVWVIGIDPDHEEARAALGFFRTKEGKWVKGILGGDTSKDTEAEFKKALKFYQKGDDEKAIEILEALRTENPQFLEAHYLLGDIYVTSGRVGHAKREFEALVKTDTSYSWGHYGIALVRLAQKKYIEAGSAAKTAINLARDVAPPSRRRAMEAEFYYVLGLSYRFQGAGGGAEAEKAFKDSVERNRRHFRAWTELGILYGGKGKAREAYSAFGKALAVESRCIPARFNWGVALYRAGNQKEALAKLKPLTRTPTLHVEALKIVGRCYHRFNDFGRARQYYQQYLNNGGKDSKVSEWLREVKN